MEKSNFEQAKELEQKIKAKEENIWQLNKLLTCCGLSIEISGTQPNMFSRMKPYSIYDKALIKDILTKERDLISSELEVMRTSFNEIVNG